MPCRRIYHWLYRVRRPNAVARAINCGTAMVYALGIASNFLVTLGGTWAPLRSGDLVPPRDRRAE